MRNHDAQIRMICNRLIFCCLHQENSNSLRLTKNFLFTGLRGTIRIGKLYNDTEKVKELMLWWSSNVGERISKLQQNISFDCKDNATCTKLKDQPIKGNIYRLSIFFLGQYL